MVNDIKNVLKLSDIEINEMKFNQLIEIIEGINEYFSSQGSDSELEETIELYQKTVQLIAAARKRLVEQKKKKEEIDKQLEAIMSEDKSSEKNLDNEKILLDAPTSGDISSISEDNDDSNIPF